MTSVPKPSVADLDIWMVRFQQADPEAPRALVRALSPPLLRFFRSQLAIREQADDLLQETWLRIHRVRHTYRPGEPAEMALFLTGPAGRHVKINRLSRFPFWLPGAGQLRAAALGRSCRCSSHCFVFP